MKNTDAYTTYSSYSNPRDIPQGESRTYYTRGACPCGSHHPLNHTNGGFVKWLVRGTSRGCSCFVKRVNIGFSDLPKAEQCARM